ncbi:MAG: Unknown protein [uncultured Sulfurovum sp.]|uniref:DUF4178 domain-containing protein n=1 Tax=uncultured Sulfurovum sp. TaxID=269237 RepID=A0A6S6SJN7_9BACT|nr:MAG: Unknown protein [uncultured Sulfurovum sp.]
MSQVKSIKCTNCAAPLSLIGGGRVESITCSYCKSVLDLNDNYKVLSNFKNVKESQKLPFAIGMVGRIKDIDYTIIGRVTYAAREYPHGEWTDFLLFSPLYGYAYLTYEDGHLIYSKRNRTFPNVTWSELTQHSSIGVDRKDFTPFDHYEAKIVYIEGELTWLAKRNDKTYFVDLINPPFGISAEKTNSEIEYYKSEYLDSTTVYDAFNIEAEDEAKTFNVLKPFKRPFLKSLSYIAFFVLFIIALFALVGNVDGSGKLIKSISADNQAVKSTDFTVNSSKYLVDLELRASKAKELNNFNLQIHKDKNIIFSLTPQSAYIFNSKTNHIEKKLHPWDKDSKKVRVSLNLEELGTYHLSIKPINPSIKSTLFIRINEASSRLNYLGWFFAFTFILWILYKFYQWRYKRKLAYERGIDIENEDLEHNTKSGIITIVLIIIAIAIIIAFGN